MTNTFDRIYIINLESDEERRKRVIEEAEKHQLLGFTRHLTIFPALDGRRKRPPLSFKGPGSAYGCTLSHLGCISDAIERNHSSILICEDDIIFHKLFASKWSETTVPSDTQLLYLGAAQMSWMHIALDDNSWYKCRGTLGAHAYALYGPDIMRCIVDTWDGVLPIDEHMVKVQNHAEGCYALYPNLLIQGIEDSHIRMNNPWRLAKVAATFRWNLSDYDL